MTDQVKIKISGKAASQPDEIRAQVREHYGKFAEAVSSRSGGSCCGPSKAEALITPDMIYQTGDVKDLPSEVRDLSAGCGDPITLASLEPGQTVLDLGAGGGIDCFLAAQRVGENGQVIGVDMTQQMIDQARANKERLGVMNVEFRLGEIEHLPVADQSVDVVISNCVINLSPDKPQVFREAYRVLRPGGKLAVSDIVTDGPLPQEVKDSLAAWAGCVAGAIDAKDYAAGLEQAGFTDVVVEPVEIDETLKEEAAIKIELDGATSFAQKVYSARITAHRPTD